MFRLNKKDIAYYLLERARFWSFLMLGVCSVGIALAINELPATIGTARIGISLIVAWVCFLCLGGLSTIWLADSTEDRKARRSIVRNWKKITNLSLFLLPLDEQEVKAMAPHLRNILMEYAAASKGALKKREDARFNLDASRIDKIAKPTDLSGARSKRTWARVAFEKAEIEAELKHRQYLTAWDYLTKDERDLGVGFLRDLRSYDPKEFRMTVNAIG